MAIEEVKISSDQAQAFRQAKRLDPEDASRMRHLLWKAIKVQHGLNPQGRFKVQVEDIHSPLYLVVCDKYTGVPVGRAKSGMPYGKVAIANMIPFLNSTWDEKHALPIDAVAIGGGLFIKGGDIYFPAI